MGKKSNQLNDIMADTDNPFKGADSYSEEDADRFYGRDKEKNELISIIGQNTLTLLYSRSGVGKSSLLKASIIPILKNLPFYMPVYIRVGDGMITEKIKNFSDAVIHSIQTEAEKCGVSIVSDNLMPMEPMITSFIYFSRFYKKNNEKKVVIPVLIFDQFEEIFTTEFKKANVKELLYDLRNIIESSIPDYIHDIFESTVVKENSEEITKTNDAKFDNNLPLEEKFFSLKDALQANNKWYRVVFSFREEYLPKFESLRDILPSIASGNGRFQLETFSVEKGSNIIHEISDEKIKPDIAGHLARLISKSEENAHRFKTEVQPFLLSQVCYHLYDKIVDPDDNNNILQAIRQEDAGIVDKVIADYFKKVFKKVSYKSRKFVEEELVTDQGKRTMYALDNVRSENVKDEIISLCNNPDRRYLNLVDYFNVPHIEVLHDRLLRPLIKSRKKRRATETGLKIFGVMALIFIPVYFLFYYLPGREQKKKNLYDQFTLNMNTIVLDHAASEIDKNPFGALMEAGNYYDKLIKLPVYIGVYGQESGSITSFKDSIVNLFQNKPFFYEYNDGFGFKVSPSGNFRHSDSLGSNSEIIYKIEKLSGINYTFYGTITYKIPQKVSSTDERLNIKEDFSDNYRPRFFFSQDDSLAFFNTGTDILVIEPFRHGGNIRASYIVKIPFEETASSQNFVYSSLDSKFLLFFNFSYGINSDRTLVKVFDLKKRINVSNVSVNFFKSVSIKRYFYKVGHDEIYFVSEDEAFDSDKSYTTFEVFNFKSKNKGKKIEGDNLNYNLLALGYLLYRKDNAVHLYALKTETDLIIDNSFNEFTYAHVSPVKKQIVLVGRYGEVRIFDLLTKKLVKERNLLISNERKKKYRSYINSFLLEKEQLLVINYNGDLELVDIDNNFKSYSFQKYKGPLIHAYFAPDSVINLVNANASLTRWHYRDSDSENLSFDTLYNIYSEIPKLYTELASNQGHK